MIHLARFTALGCLVFSLIAAVAAVVVILHAETVTAWTYWYWLALSLASYIAHVLLDRLVDRP